MKLYEYKAGHFHLCGVHVPKRHVVKFGTATGTALMAADMLFAVGIAHLLSDHLAHVLGSSGATMAGAAAAVDFFFEG